MAEKRLAIVVQRCHESIVGGSEALAWLYATMLAEEYSVEIITTTSLDYMTWKNELKAGPEERDGITLRRFDADFERTNYFRQLNKNLNSDYRRSKASRTPVGNWRPALQEEFIRYQGPYSAALFDYLEENQSSYDVIIFFTYLYAPTYFGMSVVDPKRTVLVPTLHDEPPAYLPVFRSYGSAAKQIIWLTKAERRLGKRLWGTDKGAVIGIPVGVPEVEPVGRPYPYLLYSGRIDLSKGCGMLIDSFLAYKDQNPSDLKLVLTGVKVLQLKKHSDIAYEGRVDHEMKFRLMKGALGFVMPSPYESFSIATLEAMGQGTPVIVNERCEVLKDHAVTSGAGKCFRNEIDFAEAIDWVGQLDASQRAQLSAQAKQHVLTNYALEEVRSKLVSGLHQIGR